MKRIVCSQDGVVVKARETSLEQHAALMSWISATLIIDSRPNAALDERMYDTFYGGKAANGIDLVSEQHVHRIRAFASSHPIIAIIDIIRRECVR